MASFLPPTSKLSIDSIWFCYFISPLPSCSLLSRYSLWFSTNQKSSKLFDRIIQHSRILQHRSGLFSTSYGRRDLISSPLYHVRSDRYLSPPPRFFSGEEGKEGRGGEKDAQGFPPAGSFISNDRPSRDLFASPIIIWWFGPICRKYHEIAAAVLIRKKAKSKTKVLESAN